MGIRGPFGDPGRCCGRRRPVPILGEANLYTSQEIKAIVTSHEK